MPRNGHLKGALKYGVSGCGKGNRQLKRVFKGREIFWTPSQDIKQLRSLVPSSDKMMVLTVTATKETRWASMTEPWNSYYGYRN